MTTDNTYSAPDRLPPTILELEWVRELEAENRRLQMLATSDNGTGKEVGKTRED